MNKYKCIRCSTVDEPVFVTPIEQDGHLKCPHCHGIEIEEVENND